MSKSQPIETMPKEGEFLAKSNSGMWSQVEYEAYLSKRLDDIVVRKIGSKAGFHPVAWSELPDSETEAKRQAVIDAAVKWEAIEQDFFTSEDERLYETVRELKLHLKT